MDVNDIADPSNSAQIVELLAQALTLAGEQADGSPLDLYRLDLCVDLADLHSRAVAIAGPRTSGPVDIDGLELTEVLERAEIATRSLALIEGESAGSELIGGLCDAIREARSRA